MKCQVFFTDYANFPAKYAIFDTNTNQNAIIYSRNQSEQEENSYPDTVLLKSEGYITK